MSKEITDDRMLSYLEGVLPTEEAQQIDAELAGSAVLRERLEQLRLILDTMEQSTDSTPPPQVAWGFKAALAEEVSRTPSGTSNPWGWRVAAAVTLLVLGFAGGRLSTPPQDTDNLVALQLEISDLRQAVMQRTLQSPSASERIRAVNQIETEVTSPSPELLRSLINTVKGDDSPNVRYAAVEALEPYMDNESVRLELISALETQSDPFLQIAIINWLVEAEEQAAISAIKKLIKNEDTTPEVKQQGQLAIDILI